MPPTRTTTLLRSALLSAAAAAALPNPSSATNATWTSLTSGTWTTPANWSTNPTYPNNASPSPDSAYNVTLLRPAGALANIGVTLSSNITLDSLTINTSSSLYHKSGTLRPGAMSVSGFFTLSGTLAGGTLSRASGSNITLTGAPVIDGTTLLADLAISDGSRLTLPNPQPYDYTLSVGKVSDLTPTSLTVAGALTGAGEIRFIGASYSSTPSTLLFTANPTIGLGFTLRGGPGVISSTAGPITNVGTILADINNQRPLSVTSPLINQSLIQALNGGIVTLPDFTNNGVISAAANSILNLAGINNGSITLTDSTLQIIGPLTGNPVTLTNSNADIVVNLPTLHADALPIPGRIRVARNGTLDNAASTLSVSAARPWTLIGGTITGGTINSPDATPINVEYSFNTKSRISSAILNAPVALGFRSDLNLDNVTVNAPVTLTPHSAVYQTPFPDNFDHFVFNGGSVALPNGALPAEFLAGRTLPPLTRVRVSAGSLDNTGKTLVLPCDTALYETTIKGGTIAGPGRLGLDWSVVRLTDLTLATDLDLVDIGPIFDGSIVLDNSTIRFLNTGVDILDWQFTYGSTAALSGNGTLSFESTLPAKTIVVYGNYTPTFGPGVKIVTNTASVTFRDPVTLQGTAEARNGHTLTFSRLSTSSTGTLAAYDSTLVIAHQTIVTNNFNLLLSGPNATIVGIDGALPISRNNGSLTLTNGKKLTLINLTSTGSITVGPNASLLVAAPFTNTGSITLAGGTLVIGYPTAGPSPIDAFRQQFLSSLIRAADGTPPHLRPAYAEASAIPESRRAAVALRTVDTTSLILLLAPTGDANLDGAIDSDDYALLDRSLAVSRTNAHWTDGDFNYDGAITPADYLLIDTAYLKAHGLESVGSFLAHRQSQFGNEYLSQLLTSIPEPSLALSSILYSLSSLLLTRRRKIRAN